MAVGDNLLWLVVALGCVGAAAAGVLSLWRPPRCPDCHARTEISDAEILPSIPPVMWMTYRCPRCRRTVQRRCVGDWD
jgi:hypothetical protein